MGIAGSGVSTDSCLDVLGISFIEKISSKNVASLCNAPESGLCRSQHIPPKSAYKRFKDIHQTLSCGWDLNISSYIIVVYNRVHKNLYIYNNDSTSQEYK